MVLRVVVVACVVDIFVVVSVVVVVVVVVDVVVGVVVVVVIVGAVVGVVLVVLVVVVVDVVVGERPNTWSEPPAQWHPGRADVHAHVMLLQGKARYGEGGYLLAAEIGSRGIRPCVCLCVRPRRLVVGPR